MTRNHLIRLTAGIALLSMLLLLYWVFAFCCMTVFGLKVFGENMTETFLISILGVLSLLAGSLIVNVVLNLTKIADSLAGETSAAVATVPRPMRSTFGWVVITAIFPLIAVTLWAGDWASTRRKEQRLTEAARTMLRDNPREIEQLANYSFTPAYVDGAKESLQLFSRIDERSPRVVAIVEDRTPERQFLLGFDNYSGWGNNNRTRADFIYSCSPDEREYLRRVFEGQETNHRFSASDGQYELYVPVRTAGRTVVMYFSDANRYGKLGS